MKTKITKSSPTGRIQVAKMYKLYIGGKFTRTESERYFEVVSVPDGKKLCNVSRASRKDLRNAVESAAAGFKSWGSTTAYNRGQILYRLSEMLETRKQQFTEEISLVTGKSKRKTEHEIETSVDRIVFYAGLADKWMQLNGTVNPVQPGYFNFSIPEPTGIVGLILPANENPLLSLLSVVLPVIVSGNSVVIISQYNTSLPQLTLSEVISTSDFPAGSVNILTGEINELYKHLAGHYGVNALANADNSLSKKELIELCANNLKRYKFFDLEKINDNSKFENPELLKSFTEIKTVWHTVGN